MPRSVATAPSLSDSLRSAMLRARWANATGAVMPRVSLRIQARAGDAEVFSAAGDAAFIEHGYEG
jgi:hypothetical protein